MNEIPQISVETAIRQSKMLGHTLTGFERESPHSATAQCIDCGLSVQINVNSMPGWFRIDNLEVRCQELLESRR